MNEEIKPIPSLRSQSAWLLMARFVGYFFAFLLPLLVVRFLTQEQVGTYRLIFQVIVNAVGILPLGFSLSAYYFLARSPEHRARTVLNILIFNFAAGGLAFAVLYFNPWILGWLLRSAELARLAPLAGAVIWLWILGLFLEVVAVANREPKTATAFIILSQFTKTLLMTAAVVVFSTVDAILYAALVQAVLQVLVLLFYLGSRFPRFWTGFDPGFFRKQLAYALPFGLAGVLWILQTDIHNYFVGYRFGEVGFAIYAYGCFEFPLITMIYESISAVLIPKMSELQSEGRTRDIIDTTVSAMNKLALAYLPIFVFLMIVADVFIIALFTADYAASIPVFRVNLLLLPVYVFMLDPVARAYEEVGRFLLKFRVFLLAAIIAALWFGIRHFDLTGMISIVVVSIVIERIVTFFKIKKLLGLRAADAGLLRNVLKTAVAALAAGLVLLVFHLLAEDLLLPWSRRLAEDVLGAVGVERFAGFFGGGLYLGFCLAVFAPVYLLLVKWFDLLREDEKQLLRRGLAKLPLAGRLRI